MLLALGLGYVAVAAGFFTLITRTAVADPEEARPLLYIVEGSSDQHQKAA